MASRSHSLSASFLSSSLPPFFLYFLHRVLHKTLSNLQSCLRDAWFSLTNVICLLRSELFPMYVVPINERSFHSCLIASTFYSHHRYCLLPLPLRFGYFRQLLVNCSSACVAAVAGHSTGIYCVNGGRSLMWRFWIYSNSHLVKLSRV